MIPFWIPDRAGGASRWWLYGSLQSLQADLEALGSRLTLRSGSAVEAVAALIAETGAAAVACNQDSDPVQAPVELAVRKLCLQEGALFMALPPASLLFPPGSVLTSTGTPFKVFTPFWRKCLAQGIQRRSLPVPRWRSPRRWPAGLALDQLGLRAGSHLWDGGLHEAWKPGEKEAEARLDRFLDGRRSSYAKDRDYPAVPGTGRLSPHLHFGEIGPVQIVERAGESGIPAQADPFVRQIGWREFSRHLLHHFPSLTEAPLRPEFERMPWRRDRKGLVRWQQGRTGYPLVDAGMRELWTTGWMHNRVRMVVASFLAKHLLIDWRHGARWFMDTLVDADRANNYAGWQWAAGTGTDAAPWFRIFNPTAQSRRYDPQGRYLRRWIPELRDLGDRHIHDPSRAPSHALGKAGVVLGRDYPRPLVEHGFARQRALVAYRNQVQRHRGRHRSGESGSP